MRRDVPHLLPAKHGLSRGHRGSRTGHGRRSDPTEKRARLCRAAPRREARTPRAQAPTPGQNLSARPPRSPNRRTLQTTAPRAAQEVGLGSSPCYSPASRDLLWGWQLPPDGAACTILEKAIHALGAGCEPHSSASGQADTTKGSGQHAAPPSRAQHRRQQRNGEAPVSTTDTLWKRRPTHTYRVSQV